MFSARRGIPTNREYDKGFLEKLGKDLSEAGFDDIRIKLPHNLVGMEQNEISFKEFVERERNYPSVILCARSAAKSETLKVLFVNISRKAFFVDDTFPSGHSEPPEMFVQSPDPARVYALTGFFSDYFAKEAKQRLTALGVLSFIAAISALAAEVLVFLKTSRGFLSATYTSGWAIAADLAICLAAPIVLYNFFTKKQGLYIHDRPRRNIWDLANQAVRGEVKDNPLVSLVFSVLGALITAIILKVFNLL